MSPQLRKFSLFFWVVCVFRFLYLHRDDALFIVVGELGGYVAQHADVDDRDGPLGLDDDVAAVEQAAGHTLPVPVLVVDHLVRGLEAGVGDPGHGQLLVVGLVGGG